MAWVTNFLDGFDHYASADVGSKWDVNTQAATVDSTIYRNSGQSLKVLALQGGSVTKRLNSAASNICVGFGLRLAGTNSISSFNQGGDCMLALSNDQDAGINAQFSLTTFSDGKIHVARCTNYTGYGSTGSTQLGVGTTSLSPNTWYYIECRVFIHATAGAVELRVNGVVDLLLTGVNTKASSTLAVAEFLQFHTAYGNNFYVDDLYVRTEASSTEVTGGFLGDIKVKPYYPNADGTYTAMTCSTGSTHNTLVDENPPNTTDYVSSSTALQKDSYGFQDASETGSIKAVQLSAYCYKMDAGFRGVDVFVRSSSTENFATSQPLSTSPRYKMHVWEQDPNTSADWSQTNLNAAEFGVRISADL
jgi:hypothetical protein